MTGPTPPPANPASSDLVDLPDARVIPTPGTEWARARPEDADLVAAIAAVCDPVFATNPHPELALTLGCAVIVDGRVVYERYGPDTDAATPLLSWSVAKSVTHALVGRAAHLGHLDLAASMSVPEWSAPDDPRRAIGIDDLLAMRSGLRFAEDYIDADVSNCIEMLFGSGAADVAHYAASLPLEHPPDTAFNYSSGTTNIVVRHLTDALGGGSAADRERVLRAFLADELLGPIGIASADPRFDEAGTWVGSSYLYMPLLDFARFGQLYLCDGVWDGRRLMPEGWVDHARRPRSVDPDNGLGYGAQWWIRGDTHGTFFANGHEGQRISVIPALRSVVVRFGKTPAQHRPALDAFSDELITTIARYAAVQTR